MNVAGAKLSTSASSRNSITAISRVLNSHFVNIEAPATLTKSCQAIKGLDVGMRRELLDMPRYLFDEWPERFVRLCETYNVWSAALLRELNPAPFWYWSVVHDSLYRVSYMPSDEEIRSAAAYLTRCGVALNKRSISRRLSTNNDIFHKRKSRSALAHLLHQP